MTTILNIPLWIWRFQNQDRGKQKELSTIGIRQGKGGNERERAYSKICTNFSQ